MSFNLRQSMRHRLCRKSSIVVFVFRYSFKLDLEIIDVKNVTDSYKSAQLLLNRSDMLNKSAYNYPNRESWSATTSFRTTLALNGAIHSIKKFQILDRIKMLILEKLKQEKFSPLGALFNIKLIKPPVFIFAFSQIQSNLGPR